MHSVWSVEKSLLLLPSGAHSVHHKDALTDAQMPCTSHEHTLVLAQQQHSAAFLNCNPTLPLTTAWLPCGWCCCGFSGAQWLPALPLLLLPHDPYTFILDLSDVLLLLLLLLLAGVSGDTLFEVPLELTYRFLLSKDEVGLQQQGGASLRSSCVPHKCGTG